MSEIPIAPTASIIVATYNRAQTLLYAIRSVRHSSFDDWELIIVGDGCTDDTEAAVQSVGDRRIRFVNLPDNSGGQSAPNNAGVAMARGRYVFFLNHDDMYFPDHLSRSITFLEATGADLIFSPVVLLERSGRECGPPDPSCDRIALDGEGSGRFDPGTFIIASSWAMRRETCSRVGPWLAAERTRLSPSQEWIFRAWRTGQRIRYHPHVSVLCIHAGTRRLSYLRPGAGSEHRRAWGWIEGGDSLRAALLACIAVHQGATLRYLARLHQARQSGLFARLRNRAVSLAGYIGVHPVALERRLRGEAKGAWIAGIRAHTLEPETLHPGESVNVGELTAERFLISGWHDGDGDRRWTSEAVAEIGFRVVPSDTALGIELVGRPLRLPEEVAFLINGSPALRHRFSAPDEAVTIPIPPSADNVLLAIVVESPTSPDRLGLSHDQRTLGFLVCSLRLVGQPLAPVLGEPGAGEP
jgi:glycosyltransferase involved in cell wall biosynthesis